MTTDPLRWLDLQTILYAPDATNIRCCYEYTHTQLCNQRAAWIDTLTSTAYCDLHKRELDTDYDSD